LRLKRDKQENDARLAAKALAKLAEVEATDAQSEAERAEKERKRAIIQAAIERARQQKEAASTAPASKKP
jgi:electron transport complex protein RnfB